MRQEALNWWNSLNIDKRIVLRDKYNFKYLLQVEKEIEHIYNEEKI